MKRSTWFIFSLLLSVSCLDDPDCFRLNNNLIGISFKILGVGNDGGPIIGIDSPDAPDENFFSGNITTAVVLPLNVLKEETLFRVHSYFETKLLRLGYKRQIQFVSEDCGERYFYSDLKVLEHDFDSVRLINGTPSPTGVTNVEIYRCARTNLAGVTFKKIDGENVVDSLVTIGGIQSSSFIFLMKPEENATMVELPFNTGLKTLTISYKRDAATIAQVCGEQTLFSKLKITSTSLDTIRTTIVKDSIQDPPIINFEIIL